MQILKEQKEKMIRDAIPSPVHVIIPVQVPVHVAKKKSRSKFKRDKCISLKKSQRSLDNIRCKKEKSIIDHCKVSNMNIYE